jgi:hypothetical protein
MWRRRLDWSDKRQDGSEPGRGFILQSGVNLKWSSSDQQPLEE